MMNKHYLQNNHLQKRKCMQLRYFNPFYQNTDPKTYNVTVQFVFTNKSILCISEVRQQIELQSQ